MQHNSALGACDPDAGVSANMTIGPVHHSLVTEKLWESVMG